MHWSVTDHFQLVGIFKIWVKCLNLGQKQQKKGKHGKNCTKLRKIEIFWNIFVQRGVNPKSLVAALTTSHVVQGGLQYLRHPGHAHQWLHPGGPASTAS